MCRVLNRKPVRDCSRAGFFMPSSGGGWFPAKDSSMVALYCDDWCEPAGMRLGEAPDTKPGPGEIAVAAEAAALNFADTLMVTGKYQVKPPFPFSPGFEAAGREGEGRLHLVLAGDHQRIGKVQRCRLRRHGDLARAGFRIGSFAQAHSCRLAPIIAIEGNHAAVLRWEPSTATRRHEKARTGAVPHGLSV